MQMYVQFLKCNCLMIDKSNLLQVSRFALLINIIYCVTS